VSFRAKSRAPASASRRIPIRGTSPAFAAHNHEKGCPTRRAFRRVGTTKLDSHSSVTTPPRVRMKAVHHREERRFSAASPHHLFQLLSFRVAAIEAARNPLCSSRTIELNPNSVILSEAASASRRIPIRGTSPAFYVARPPKKGPHSSRFSTSGNHETRLPFIRHPAAQGSHESRGSLSQAPDSSVRGPHPSKPAMDGQPHSW
jgi:hypothetical protein